MNMRIIPGSNVDLISPFPEKEVQRLYGWLHCYRTLTECDDSPKGPEATCEFLLRDFRECVTYGMIDKNHLTNIKHEAPLVGAGSFAPKDLKTS